MWTEQNIRLYNGTVITPESIFKQLDRFWWVYNDLNQCHLFSLFNIFLFINNWQSNSFFSRLFVFLGIHDPIFYFMFLLLFKSMKKPKRGNNYLPKSLCVCVSLKLILKLWFDEVIYMLSYLSCGCNSVWVVDATLKYQTLSSKRKIHDQIENMYKFFCKEELFSFLATENIFLIEIDFVWKRNFTIST